MLAAFALEMAILSRKLPSGLPPPALAALLSDPNNYHYLYDLLDVLRTEFLPAILIQPNEKECISADRVTSFAESISAIPAYVYLGDVAKSPDRQAEKFEDDYIEELFKEIYRLGYRAVTYMPPRNTLQQLTKLQQLLVEYGLMELFGVGIESSRQFFNCPEILKKEFIGLIDTTWSLIAHEHLAAVDSRYGLYSLKNPLATLEIYERLDLYAAIGKRFDLYHPEDSAVIFAHQLDKGVIG
jgi:hypothetical protein